MSEDRLPESLSTYYGHLIERLGVSDAQRDLTAIVAVLSQVDEPLDEAGIAYLLSGGSKGWESWLPRVAVALRLGAALVCRATSPDTLTGWMLYHETFREYVAGAPELSGSVAEYRGALIEAADRWQGQLAPGLRSLRAHLFRRGTAYALRWPQADGVLAARARLVNFAYLQARTAALRVSDCFDLALEYSALRNRQEVIGADPEIRLWEVFFRERVHLMLRGDAAWGAHKTLLQLAVDHADDSPVTAAAEAWLAAGSCDWLWLRQAHRPPRVMSTGCLRVFQGSGGAVLGAMSLPGNRALSWTRSGRAQLWDLASWLALATLDGHPEAVLGAAVLPGDRLCTWCRGGTVCLWDQSTGQALGKLSGAHPKRMSGALLLADGGLLSWSDDSFASDFGLRVWDLSTGAVRLLHGHGSGVMGATVLPDGRILSWSRDATLRMWDIGGERKPVVLCGHSDTVNGATVLADGNLLSWSWDGSVCLWDASNGGLLRRFFTDSGYFQGATLLVDGSLLAWTEFEAVRWRGDGVLLWKGRLGQGGGCTLLRSGALHSWSSPMRLWDINTGAELRALEGTTGDDPWVNGAAELPNGQVLAWGRAGSLCLWDADSGAALVRFDGHSGAVNGAVITPSGGLLSWSDDGTLRLWDLERRVSAGPGAAPIGAVMDAMVLANGRSLCWGSQQLYIVGDDFVGGFTCLLGHKYEVRGATLLEDGRLLSWDDFVYRVWDPRNGSSLAEIQRTSERHHPEIFLPWYRATINEGERRASNIRCGVWTASGGEGEVSVAAEAGLVPLARWLCDGAYRPLLLLPTGGVLVTGADTGLLHLCWGHRRVSVAEASALASVAVEE
jgi:WD40 repeat protein